MRLDKLMLMQKELDDYIVEYKDLGHISERDMLNSVFCALYSELYEVQEEVRLFKVNEGLLPKVELEKAILKEMIDVLHFLLSIGYRLSLDKLIYAEVETIMVDSKPIDVPELFFKTVRLMDRCKAFKFWSSKPSDSTYLISMSWIAVFSDLWGMMYSITDSHQLIIDAYIEKYKINKLRQEEGY